MVSTSSDAIAAADAAAKWANSPVRKLAWVELLVTLCFVVFAISIVFGWRRRSLRSAFWRFMFWAACMVSYPTVSYTIGLMQSAPYRSQLSVVWACFLLLLLGCGESTIAFSTDIDAQQAQIIFNQGLQCLYVLLPLANSVRELDGKMKARVFVLWGACVAKMLLKVKVYCTDASRKKTMLSQNKIISDYMRWEHEGWDNSQHEGFKSY